jgi:hypothetical protein
VRDLAMLVGRKARDSAALLSAYDAERPSLEARVQRASERRWQTRLRSRGRRCVLPSSGFRVERSGNLRVYRRADVELDTVLAGIAGSLRGDVAGGPAAGPAPDPFARGQGALEPGAPSSGPVGVHEYRGSVLPWIVPSRGMRAWRGAHALLLRGFQTLTPLALVEERRFGGTRRAWLLTRDESIDPLFDSRDPVSRSARARLAARALGALHESGLRFARFDSRALGVRPIGPDAVVVRAADEIRTGAVSVSARSRELERLASDLDEPDRVEQGRLLVSYRESGSAAEAAWCRAFPEAASSR